MIMKFGGMLVLLSILSFGCSHGIKNIAAIDDANISKSRSLASANERKYIQESQLTRSTCLSLAAGTEELLKKYSTALAMSDCLYEGNACDLVDQSKVSDEQGCRVRSIVRGTPLNDKFETIIGLAGEATNESCAITLLIHNDLYDRLRKEAENNVRSQCLKKYSSCEIVSSHGADIIRNNGYRGCEFEAIARGRN